MRFSMSSITTMLTHPGGAHKDEFLACCVLLAKHPVPIVRREPSDADLCNPSTCVIDVGHQHDPELHNFDHHQLPRDHPPTCSLSLVLQHLGLYEDAKQFCDWLEVVEWFDCRGPIDTARWLGVPPEVCNKLISPVDVTLLRRFGALNELLPGDPVWEVMRMIGEDLVGYVEGLKDRLEYLDAHAQVWSIMMAGRSAKILFLPRTEPPLEDPSMALERYIERIGLSSEVVGIVSPDRRGRGYGLSRYRDCQRLNFTKISECSDVHFAHARGFVAKTSAEDEGRLRELIRLSAESQDT